MDGGPEGTVRINRILSPGDPTVNHWSPDQSLVPTNPRHKQCPPVPRGTTWLTTG